MLDRVQYLMAQKGIKKTELMHRIGAERALFDTWEAQRNIPSIQYANLAQALDTTIAYLCGETDNPDIPPSPGAESSPEPGATSSPGMAAPSAEYIQQMQRIVQSLQGLDPRGLRLVEGLIDLYRRG